MRCTSPHPMPARLRLLLPLLLALAGACHAAPDPSARLAALAQRFYDAQARMDPVFAATLAGDNRFDDQLPVTIAPAQRRAYFGMLRGVERELKAIDPKQLAAADQLNHTLLARDVHTRLGFERFHDHLLPLQQMNSIPVMLALLGGGQAEQPIGNAAQVRAYLKRVSQLPAWLAQATTNMREGMRRGIVQPKPVVAAALKQLQGLLGDCATAHPYCAPIRSFPASITPAEREVLSRDYQSTVNGRVVPALQRFSAFVESEYLPAARDSAGLAALPDGAAWYRQWVRDQTTTELTPAQIHAVGLKEVARIQGELARIAPQLGYEGDPRQLLAWVRTNPKFLPFRSEAQILERYREINRTVAAALPQLFGRAPKAPLEIKPEPELTKATASDHYNVPAEDGSRPGTFWAVINDPAAYDASGMTALFLHEGQPGHHFHLALQQEMPLPLFRKRTWINAYGEGWALYAETLGHEMGLYKDPAAYVGELRLEIARAARLVVDTGMHAEGWSRERALDYWIATVGVTPAQAASQIDRYMAWPGQALGYKLGSLKIQELRERAQAALGERFRLAAFHDAVLAEGSLPLTQLEAQIGRWIAVQQQQQPPAPAR